MGELAGKVAIVTGASSGIGHAAALAFARSGAAVVVTARREAELARLVDTIRQGGGRASLVAGDAADEATAEAVVAAATGGFGGLHAAFNNAGTLGTMAPLGRMAAADWQAVLATNLTGAFLAAKHQAEAMAAGGGGSVVFTSTFVGPTLGFPGMVAYAASKAGILGLMRVLAVEYAERGVRANAILSGGVDTPMGRHVANTPETRAFVERLHALRRVAAPEEIARVALFLASDAASFMTGAAVPVDGGLTVTRT